MNRIILPWSVRCGLRRRVGRRRSFTAEMQCDRVRITAPLIEVPADRHMWARSYEGDLRHTLTLQNRVALAIAEQIRATLNRQETAALEKSKAMNPALIYVGPGDNDQAMIWLNKAYQARFNPSILLRPAFDPLRSDARFQDLLRRIGLP
jgi:hypothetical protein